MDSVVFLSLSLGRFLDDQEEMQYVLDALQASDAENCKFFLSVIESIIERRVLQSGTIEEYYYDN
jgi:hypothetical protein